MEKPKILIIDDDPNIRKTLSDTLKVKGYDSSSAANGAEGLEILKRFSPNLAVIDLGLPDISGIEVLEGIKTVNPAVEAIILTGNASLDSAIEATNKGAFSYLLKPYDVDQLMLNIKRALEKQEARETVVRHSLELERVNAELNRTNEALRNEIVERKRAEEESRKLVVELTEALSKIKILKGLLPICSYCKKIRNDKGYWEQVESYIAHHSDVDFTHGICPECMKKYYPEFQEDE